MGQSKQREVADRAVEQMSTTALADLVEAQAAAISALVEQLEFAEECMEEAAHANQARENLDELHTLMRKSRKILRKARAIP